MHTVWPEKKNNNNNSKKTVNTVFSLNFGPLFSTPDNSNRLMVVDFPTYTLLYSYIDL